MSSVTKRYVRALTLLTQRGWTREQLANELGVSIRTVNRIIQAVREAGFLLDQDQIYVSLTSDAIAEDGCEYDHGRGLSLPAIYWLNHLNVLWLPYPPDGPSVWRLRLLGVLLSGKVTSTQLERAFEHRHEKTIRRAIRQLRIAGVEIAEEAWGAGYRYSASLPEAA